MTVCRRECGHASCGMACLHTIAYGMILLLITKKKMKTLFENIVSIVFLSSTSWHKWCGKRPDPQTSDLIKSKIHFWWRRAWIRCNRAPLGDRATPEESEQEAGRKRPRTTRIISLIGEVVPKKHAGDHLSILNFFK